MKTILFNLHDLILVSTIGLCALLAVICAISRSLAFYSRCLLAAFFVLIGLMVLDTLFFWGERVRYTLFDLSPWLLACFSFTGFVAGPVTYWFVRAESNTAAKLPLGWIIHLIPAIVTPIYLYWVFYRHPISIQRELLLDLAVYANTDFHYFAFVSIKKLSPVLYGIVCVKYLLSKSKAPQYEALNLGYLLNFSVGFTFIFLWVLVIHIVGIWLPLAVSDVLGILGNYMKLALLIGFALIMLRRSQKRGEGSPGVAHSVDAEEIAKISAQIQSFMMTEKPHLNSQMNIERFSKLVDIPSRQVSNAINRSFEQNFHEYINRHRVDEAKRLLNDPDSSELTMLEVAELAGFNSKATFNRFFKTLTEVTPSAYRQQLQHKDTVNPSSC